MADRFIPIRLVLTTDDRQFKQAFSTLKSEGEKTALALREKFSQIGSALSGLGLGLSATLTAPLALLGKSAVSAARDMDSLQRGMVAVSGSAAAASAEMTKLREVAKLPGLGFKEAIQGSINLQAAGISAELARRSLSAFGNALATVGKGKAELDGVNLALSQIVSKGKVSAEEINQIAERVPQIRKIMQQAFGTADTEKLQKANVNSLDFIRRIVTELEKLPKVTGGAQNSFENLADTAEQALVPLGNALLRFIVPAIDRLTPVIERLSEGFASLSPTTQSLIVGFGAVVAAIGPVLFVVGGLASSITSIIATFTSFGAGAAALAGGATAASAALTGIGSAVATLAAPLAIAAGAVVALYAAWQTNFGGIRDLTAQVAEFVQVQFRQVNETYRSIAPEILAITKPVLKALEALFETSSANIKATWQSLWPALRSITEAGLNEQRGIISIHLKFLAGDFSGAFEDFKALWASRWESLKTIVAQVTTGTLDLIKKYLNNIGDLIGVARQSGQGLGDAIGAGIVGGLYPHFPIIANLIERITNLAKNKAAEAEGAYDRVRQLSNFDQFKDADKDVITSADFAANRTATVAAATKSSFPKLGGGGKGGGRTKELSEEEKLAKSIKETENQILQFANARYVRQVQLQEKRQEELQTIKEAIDLARKLQTIAPGSEGLPAILTPERARQFLRDNKPIADVFEKLPEIVKKSAEVFVADFVPGVLEADSGSRQLRDAIAGVNDELAKEIERTTGAAAQYASLKQSLETVIESTNKLTVAQKAQKAIAGLPADFNPLQRAELEKLATQARGVELQNEEEKRQREQLQRAEQTAQKIGDFFTQAFRDSFERGPKAFFDRMWQSAKETLARIGAEITKNLVLRVLGINTGRQASGGGFNLGGLFGGGQQGSGGLLGSLFGGGQSSGGGLLGGLFGAPGGTAPFAGSSSGGGLSGGILGRLPGLSGIFGRSTGVALPSARAIGNIIPKGIDPVTGAPILGSTTTGGVGGVSALSSLGAGGLLLGGGLLGSLAGGDSKIGKLLGGAGGGLLAGAVGASGLFGGGIAAALPALFSNPFTAIIGAGLIGGALLFNLLGNKDIKELRKLIKGEFAVDVKDNKILKQVKAIGEQVYGKQWKQKKLETIRLDQSKELISAYAQQTGQKGNGKLVLDSVALDPTSANNQIVAPLQRREFGGPVLAGIPYLVGERRPEVFIPDRSGQVVPSVDQYQRGNGRSAGNAGTGALQAQVAMLAAAVAALTAKIGSMSQGDIITANPDAVAESYLEAISRNNSYGTRALSAAGVNL